MNKDAAASCGDYHVCTTITHNWSELDYSAPHSPGGAKLREGGQTQIAARDVSDSSVSICGVLHFYVPTTTAHF